MSNNVLIIKENMKVDVLIIGSSAAGVVAATTGKRIYPTKDFLVITKNEKTLIPCGIPYVFGSVGSTDKNILPAEKVLGAADIKMKHAEVISIDKENRIVQLKNDETVEYEKLVLATGSLPIKPQWLKGVDLENVFTVPKDKVYLDKMQSKLNGQKKIIVIGAGFIGVEISDELVKAGKEVTLIERLPNILSLAFDADISVKAEKIIIDRGVNVKTGVGVKEIIGNGSVKHVLLENGEKIEADAVILSMGYKPNSKLAVEAGISINEMGFLSVDEYMRTKDVDIFAIGDCAEKRHFITRRPSAIMLASTAAAEARIAGMNLFKLAAIKTFSGTISIFSTALGHTGFGVAGLTEKLALEEGFDIIVGTAEGFDKHPGALKGTKMQYVKLIVGKDAGIILGGEVCGGLSVGELTNTIGIIIQNRMSVNTLLTTQIGTHPLLTSSPTGYPLIKAAENAVAQIMANKK